MDSRNGKEGWTTDGVKPFAERPVVDSPNLSQISCLTGKAENKGQSDILTSPTNPLKESDIDFVQLSRQGGHKDLLQFDDQSRNSEPVSYERKGGDWYYQDDKLENGAGMTTRSNVRDTDSEYVRLSKQGGHEGLLRIESGNVENPFVNCHGRYARKEDRMSPSSSQPAGMMPAKTNIAPGNPIWLGGSGPEKGFIPGKRFMKKEAKESPFALSDNWKGSQGRNPDKI